jgi:hypothetical protein
MKTVGVLEGADVASTVTGPMPGTLISRRQSGLPFTSSRTVLSKAAICSRSFDHATSIGHTIDATSGRSATRASTRSAKERPRAEPGKHAESLEHATDMVRQPGHHAHELEARTKQRSGAMGIERLHMHGTKPARAHDLRQPSASLRSVLLC